MSSNTLLNKLINSRNLCQPNRAARKRFFKVVHFFILYPQKAAQFPTCDQSLDRDPSNPSPFRPSFEQHSVRLHLSLLSPQPVPPSTRWNEFYFQTGIPRPLISRSPPGKSPIRQNLWFYIPFFIQTQSPLSVPPPRMFHPLLLHKPKWDDQQDQLVSVMFSTPNIPGEASSSKGLSRVMFTVAPAAAFFGDECDHHELHHLGPKRNTQKMSCSILLEEHPASTFSHYLTICKFCPWPARPLQNNLTIQNPPKIGQKGKCKSFKKS